MEPPLLVEFASPSTVERQRDLPSDLPILRNGPPGTFVLVAGCRVSLPTDQIVFCDDTGGAARVGFGGMRFDGPDRGHLLFTRVRDLQPEALLSPDRSWTMRLEGHMVSSIHVNGRRVWPA